MKCKHQWTGWASVMHVENQMSIWSSQCLFCSLARITVFKAMRPKVRVVMYPGTVTFDPGIVCPGIAVELVMPFVEVVRF